MNKTIEEAAKDFVANYYELEEYGDEVSEVEIDNSEECFVGDANHILSLPLAERLTEEEEKKKIKAFYNGDTFGELDFIEVVSCRRILKSIFGKDFFKEEE